MNLRLCYEVDKAVGLAEDEQGNPAEAYVCMSLKDVNTYNVEASKYKELHDSMIETLAKQLDCDEKHIKPITLNEYLDNTEEGE